MIDSLLDLRDVPRDMRRDVILGHMKMLEWQREEARKPKPVPKLHDFDQRTLCCTKCWMSKIDATYNKAECICADIH